jgi:hypothetical protein
MHKERAVVAAATTSPNYRYDYNYDYHRDHYPSTITGRLPTSAIGTTFTYAPPPVKSPPPTSSESQPTPRQLRYHSTYHCSCYARRCLYRLCDCYCSGHCYCDHSRTSHDSLRIPLASSFTGDLPVEGPRSLKLLAISHYYYYY